MAQAQFPAGVTICPELCDSFHTGRLLRDGFGAWLTLSSRGWLGSSCAAQLARKGPRLVPGTWQTLSSWELTDCRTELEFLTLVSRIGCLLCLPWGLFFFKDQKQKMSQGVSHSSQLFPVHRRVRFLDVFSKFLKGNLSPVLSGVAFGCWEQTRFILQRKVFCKRFPTIMV